jgi:Na+-transporting NADH:ubiquinone oxidoreductase subunit F
VVSLVGLILAARRLLLPSGVASVRVNDRRNLEGRLGEKLLETLGAAEIALPSACGGKGTCGQCRVRFVGAAPLPLPTERARLSARELARGERLACQVTLRADVAVQIPDEIFGVQRWTCRVRSARFVGTLIREIVAELPAGERIEFRAGSYVLLTVPPYRLRFRDLPVEAAMGGEWDRLGLFGYEVDSRAPVTRAYSLANPPAEDRVIQLLVRLATPPASAPPGTPPGIASSKLCALRPGETLDVAGPYGHFFADASEREMIFIGGGAGMAPLRSHVLDQLERQHSTRTISFWYGARNRRELFYADEFDRLQREHANFRWLPALSEPRLEDNWQGEVGFIHEVLERRHLAGHRAPEGCEYYLCGPPLMARATIAMLERLGVAPESIHFDDFGS